MNISQAFEKKMGPAASTLLGERVFGGEGGEGARTFRRNHEFLLPHGQLYFIFGLHYFLYAGERQNVTLSEGREEARGLGSGVSNNEVVGALLKPASSMSLTFQSLECGSMLATRFSLAAW